MAHLFDKVDFEDSLIDLVFTKFVHIQMQQLEDGDRR